MAYTRGASGGAGSLESAPFWTASPAIGPPNGGTRNGRVIYRAGANQFGGAMQIGLAGGGIDSFVWNAVPFQVGRAYIIGTGSTLRAAAVGRGLRPARGRG